MNRGGENADDMKQYSVAFKHKMVERLIGADAPSASELSKEVGIPQVSLSRWVREARTLPPVSSDKPVVRMRRWTVEEKVRILAEGSKLTGEKLMAFLERENVRLAEYEHWRISLEEGGRAAALTTRRIRELERELARKEKALAEAAALLILKKKVADLYPEDEDESTDDTNERSSLPPSPKPKRRGRD